MNETLELSEAEVCYWAGRGMLGIPLGAKRTQETVQAGTRLLLHAAALGHTVAKLELGQSFLR